MAALAQGLDELGECRLAFRIAACPAAKDGSDLIVGHRAETALERQTSTTAPRAIPCASRDSAARGKSRIGRKRRKTKSAECWQTPWRARPRCRSGNISNRSAPESRAQTESR